MESHRMLVAGHRRPPPEMAGNSLLKIRILVVDDDDTALFVVTEVLKKSNYEVTAVRNPVDAISTLRMRRGMFDLIVTDFHMPIMNGIELQRRIHQEFDLPVIMMSVDNNEYVMLRSLECGAAYFILKPIKPADCKNLWQYAVAKSGKGKSLAIIPRSLSTTMVAVVPAEDSGQALYINQSQDGFRTKVRSKNKGKERANSKKPKVAWTNFLHNRFLQAVNFIGIDKAVPKKILELMNIPGLSRQNVASHLQKYRIFLKRVAEKGKEQVQSSHIIFGPDPSLTFTLAHPPSMTTSLLQGDYRNFSLAQLQTSSFGHQVLPNTTTTTTNSLVFNNPNCFNSQGSASSSSQLQPIVGPANGALARLGSPSLRFDNLLSNNNNSNSNGELSLLSAQNAAICTLMTPKQMFENQLIIQASRGDGNSRFPENVFRPSSMLAGNTSITRALGPITNYKEPQKLTGTNGFKNYGLTGPTGRASNTRNNLGDNYYVPQPVNGDLSTQNLGEEEINMQVNNLTNHGAQNTKSSSTNYPAEENETWDIEALMGNALSVDQPAAADPDRVHQTDENASGNAPSINLDWDDYLLESLLTSSTSSPLMDW